MAKLREDEGISIYIHPVSPVLHTTGIEKQELLFQQIVDAPSYRMNYIFSATTLLLHRTELLSFSKDFTPCKKISR